jgi:TonB-linked SusC/RagA family outer membrane protein
MKKINLFMVMLLLCVNVFAESTSLKGVVLDESGASLAGVNVVVKGTTIGTMTDVDGNFQIMVENASAQTLVFSYIGYIKNEVKVGERLEFKVTLKEDACGLDEVVVVGYGVRKKSSLTGAVSSVKGETIARIPASNMKEALQGAVAGVDIGAVTHPGDDAGIQIRGQRSINANAQPLVIVDGVPGDLRSVNSYDVESVEVLKDAAATAIYGSRAANGVILVTTKRGSTSGYAISYNTYVGVQKVNLIDMQSPQQYVQFVEDATRYSNGWDNPLPANIFSTNEQAAIDNGKFTDWEDLLFQDGKLQNHHVSVSHRGDKTDMYFSLAYNKEEGYYQQNIQEQINASLTVDHRINDIFKLGLTTRYLRRDLTDPSKVGTTYMTYLNPLAPAYDENGELVLHPSDRETSAYNPLADFEDGAVVNDKITNKFEFNTFLNIKLHDCLNLRTNVGIELEDYDRGYFASSRSFKRKGGLSQAFKYTKNTLNYNINSVLTFSKKFGEHNVVADLVGEVYEHIVDDFEASGENQPVDDTEYHNLGTSDTKVEISSGYSSWALASALVRVQYDFSSKYFVNFALRNDGSSRLTEGKKWQYFPSAALAWRISEEPFLNSFDWLSNLKLRLSYGEVGNTSIDPYQTLSTLAKKPYLFGTGDMQYVFRPDRVANKDLTWEVSKTTNLGLDFGFIKGKISGSIELYQTKTENLLMERSLPVITGFSKIWQNIGETETRGVELNLETVLLKTSDFSWNASWNASRNWEEITKLLGEGDLVDNRLFIGEPISVYFDNVFDGIWQLGEEEEAAKYKKIPGDVKVKDLSGPDENGDVSISGNDDKTIIGQRSPKWLISTKHFITYKDFDFSFMVNSKWGHKIKSNLYGGIFIPSGDRWMPEHIDYWTPENPSNKFPRADKGTFDHKYRGTAEYMDGDHIKIQEISLGYTYRNDALKFFQSARIYGQVKNVGYIYKAAEDIVDPESPGFDFSVPQTFILGLNINF